VRRPVHPNAHIDYQPTAINVLGKPLALQRALRNLLDNAVLYGDRVEVRLCRKGSMALVEIRDFGPGLPETSMLAAFEPQMRLLHGQRRNPGGSGLGLGISSNIVQAHGGEIQMRNHPEGGLVVSVLLPAQPDLLDLPYSAP
jgi:signal transduction histidine kinase